MRKLFTILALGCALGMVACSGGGIVEIHQGLAVDLLIKDRELRPYFVDVHFIAFVET